MLGHGNYGRVISFGFIGRHTPINKLALIRTVAIVADVGHLKQMLGMGRHLQFPACESFQVSDVQNAMLNYYPL